MNEQNQTILIVEDDLDIADMLNAYFRVQGYNVLTVNWGEDGVVAAHANRPDLVILDIRLPDIDGFEVAARLREDRRTNQIPIIFLTEKRERADRLKGLELHAEDYITKPFDVQELRLRVRNALLRSQRSTLTHPVTGLPEGDLVDERLKQLLQGEGVHLAAISLHNLQSFREMYGFVAADDLLRAVSMMVQDTVKESGEPGDFLGHLTATDFVIISRSNHIPEMTDRLRKRLEQSFEYFYKHQDREAETFRGRGLSVSVSELPPMRNANYDLEALKQALEHISRQGEA